MCGAGAMLETTRIFLSLTHPGEIAAYVTAWEQLYSIAVRGRKARALIRGVLAELDETAGSE